MTNASGNRFAMILAAGRGERMRPLSDAMPKPLLPVGDKALIVWQIEALVDAGYTDIVINASHHAELLMAALGDGAAWRVRIRWSREATPLETAGGIVTASHLLPRAPVLVVSGDIWTRFDYGSLAPRADAMAARRDGPRAHLVMVPNPPYHAAGDFALVADRVTDDDKDRLTFGNIGVYDMSLFDELPRHAPLRMLPLYRRWIHAGIVSGERYDGPWANVGTPPDLAALDASVAARILDT